MGGRGWRGGSGIYIGPARLSQDKSRGNPAQSRSHYASVCGRLSKSLGGFLWDLSTWLDTGHRDVRHTLLYALIGSSEGGQEGGGRGGGGGAGGGGLWAMPKGQGSNA